MSAPLAIALLSGGLDSATAAALALEAGHRVIGLSFDYGQRHRRELSAAQTIASNLELDEHHCISVDLAAWGGSPLTDPQLSVPSDGVQDNVIPSTYVPGRNTVFIAIGLSLAEAKGAQRLVLGVNAVDYSGYPDCRPDYLDAFQTLAHLSSKAGREGRASSCGHHWCAGAKPESWRKHFGSAFRSKTPGAVTAVGSRHAASATAAESATPPCGTPAELTCAADPPTTAVCSLALPSGCGPSSGLGLVRCRHGLAGW